jgi:hypothetical protein
MTNAPLYIVGYLALLVPTYVLPYFGSNSIIVNSVGAAVGRGMTPLWWLHVWALVMLALMAFARGKHIGKTYIAVFSVIAAAFDMIPGLSLVPFVPTVMHLVALVLGAIGVAPQSVATIDGTEDTQKPSSNGVAITAALMTFTSILGSLWFALNATSTLSATPAQPPVTRQAEPPKTQALKQSPSAQAPSAANKTAAREPMSKTERVTSKPSGEGASSSAANQAKSEPQKSEPPKKSRYINLND